MNRFPPRPRRDYLQEQKEMHRRHLLGVFPAQYPREILWAMNILPVEIWDPPLEIHHAHAHLQPHICSVVRLGLELILQGRCGFLDGFLFPHTCDSIQNLASIVSDYLGTDKPCYFFYHPKATYQQSSRGYYRAQLHNLVAALERQFGPLDPFQLRKRVAQGERLASLMRELYDLRARGGLHSSNDEFYGVVRQGEYLHPDDFIPLLERFLAESRGGAESRPAVILSGVLPNPKEILALLDRLGVRVADDDFLSCSRRLLTPPGGGAETFDALAESYFAMPACSTRGSPIEERLNNLLVKVGRSGAKGMIFLVVKSCEPELFYLPQLAEGVKKRGVATLVIDSELNQGLSGQLTTRVEAFVEMLR